MLVYATTLWLTARAERKEVLSVVAQWLAKKTATSITAEWLAKSGEPRTRDGSRLSVITNGDTSPELWALRYAHADSEVSGRQWVTEIGLRRQRVGDVTECSVVVQTSEISARVTTPVRASRPTVVSDLADAGLLSSPTPGRKLVELNDDADAAEAFLYGVEDEGRRHPYVLVSADLETKYLVDPDRLRSLLTGLADVVVITPKADTYFLARLLGRQYAAWRGAVNIIFPKVQFPDRAFVETRRLRAEDLAELTRNGASPESEILSIVTHRTNLPMSWRALTTQRVQEAILRLEFAKRLSEAKHKGDVEEMRQLIEDIDGTQRKQIGDLTAELDELKEQLSRQQDGERRLRYELQQARDNETQGADSPLLDGRARDSMLAVLAGRATPEQVLVAVSGLYPDRLTVLPTAWKAVKRSQGFNDCGRLWDLMQKLATDYWHGMLAGGGDSEARTTFGNAFAPRESETVESNPTARKRRTFCYKGQEVTMLRHLKIGRKDSVAETMRVHFAWDAEARRVIVGHCGPHLDFY